jgi:hypothetical protein
MSNPAGQFDPYHKWLGIPLADQPPNHYRLLGIQVFESDSDTIANAADQRMTHVRSFQSGKYSAESQRLLNELAAARVCLLKPDRKTAYDETLKARQSSAVARPVDQPFENLASVIGEEGVYSARTRRQPKRREMPVIAIALVLMLVVGAVAAFVLTRGEEMPVAQDKPAAVVEEPAISVKAEPKEISPAGKDSTSAAPVAKAVSDVPLPAKDSESVKSKEPVRVIETSTGPAVVTVEKMQPLPLRIGPRPAFLMEGTFYDWVTKPEKNIPNGLLRFNVEQPGIVYLAVTWRREGVNGGWTKFRRSREGLAELGWQEVGPCDWDPDRILFKRFCTKGESHALRTNKFWPPIVILEGLPKEDFSGNVVEGEVGGWSKPGTLAAIVREEPSHAVEKPEVIEPLDGKWADLLRLIVPKTHSVEGDWKRMGPAISISKADGACRIVVPVSPKGSYDLAVEFTRNSGDAANLILPIAGRQCLLSLEKTGADLDILPRTKGFEVSADDRHKLNVQVRVDDFTVHVDAELDEKPYLHWQGNVSQISLSDAWKLPGVGQMGLCARDGSSVTFHSLKLREEQADNDMPRQPDDRVLASDTHLGRIASAKKEENHIYHLQSVRMTLLSNTAIRFQPDPETIRTSGRVLISGDGNSWTQVGNWTKESCKQAVENGGWHEISLSAMPQTKTKELFVKFDWTSGSGAMLINDVQWIASER